MTDPREADVGSIIGFGFAPYTGGTLSYIDGMGAEAFVELAKSLQKKYGERFKPTRLLAKMAKEGDELLRPAQGRAGEAGGVARVASCAWARRQRTGR